MIENTLMSTPSSSRRSVVEFVTRGERRRRVVTALSGASIPAP